MSQTTRPGSYFYFLMNEQERTEFYAEYESQQDCHPKMQFKPTFEEVMTMEFNSFYQFLSTWFVWCKSVQAEYSELAGWRYWRTISIKYSINDPSLVGKN